MIKDLKDLENQTTRAAIDIKDLKDLKRQLLTLEIAGDRPPRYDKKKRLLSHRYGARQVISYFSWKQSALRFYQRRRVWRDAGAARNHHPNLIT